MDGYLAISGPAFDAFEFIESYNGMLNATVSSPAFDERAYLARLPVRATPLTITHMRCYIGAASGNLDMGIYTWDGDVVTPTCTRQASTGSTAAAGTNAAQIIALSAAFTLQPGIQYLIALAHNAGSTLTFGRAGYAAGLSAGRTYSKAASFPLPATITDAAVTSYMPWVYGSASSS